MTTPQVYQAEDFTRELGYTLEDWGLRPGQLVTIDENDRILVDSRFLGHLTPAERASLRAPFEAQPWGIPRQVNPDLHPGWVAAAAFGGRVAGGLLFTAIGGALDGIGTTLAFRGLGQILGAAGASAIAAPDGKRGVAALGAGAGAWVPFMGAPLAAGGAYLATADGGRRRNPLSSRTKRWLWIGGGVAAALLIGGVVYARSKAAPEGPLEPKDAVDRAIGILGEGAKAHDVADAAYPLAYPDCPDVLDPEDPTHARCIEYWFHLQDLAQERLPPPTDRPSGPKAAAGPAADMKAWLDSLTQDQRSELRQIIGPSYYDPIERAAKAGDDGKTVAAVLRLEAAVRKLVAQDPIAASKQYAQLKSLLGPKLDELLNTAKKYRGEA